MACLLICESGVKPQNLEGALAMYKRFNKMKLYYRINLFGLERAKTIARQNHLPFIPVGKLTHEDGRHKWIVRKNGKLVTRNRLENQS